MPHAEIDTAPLTNGAMSNSIPVTNGDGKHSKVLSHLHSFPVFRDSLEAYKSHPYGAKSLHFVNATYQRFVAPLHPYLQTPISYLSPYLTRADELGDNGLSKVEHRFPIVKEDTSKLKQTVFNYAALPLQFAGKGRDYVLGTWQDEYRKTKGKDGVVKNVKALVSTELKLGKDGYTFFVGYWHKAKEQGNKKFDEVKQ